MKRIAFEIAASGLALGAATFGIAASVLAAPAAASPRLAADADRRAVALHEQAGAAIADGRLADAIGLLEQAVALSPRDVGYRLLLADAYMRSGRFQSARTTYGDVVAIDPGQGRAGVALALMHVIGGQAEAAVAQLEQVESVAPAADVGLAYALAGAPQRAIEVLEPAARSMGATARIRQNLALSYAFGGDWQRARTIAAQDVSPAEIGERMTQWAALAPRAGTPEPVIAMIGVAPVADAGQPVQIALATPPAALPVPSDQRVVFAAAEPVQVAPPVQAGNIAVAAPVAPESIPMPTHSSTMRAAATSVPAPVVLAAAEPVAVPAPVASAEPAEGELEASDWGLDEQGQVVLPEDEPAAEQAPAQVRYAAAARSLVRPDPVVMPVARRAVRTLAAARFANARLPGKRAADGGYVVQLGAFSSAANAERAWRRYEQDFGLSSEQPVTMTLDHQGRLLHRVAVSGFAKRSDAAQACQALKARGGDCFVRNQAGDAAIDWAARYAGDARNA